MTECEERILGWMNLGVDYEECLAPRCGRPATRWIPSHIDGKLMPACDKHYNDTKITPRWWNNARKWREDRIRELIGKKCYYCGKQAVWWEDFDGPQRVPICLAKLTEVAQAKRAPRLWVAARCLVVVSSMCLVASVVVFWRGG